MKVRGWVEHGPIRKCQWLDFGGDPDYFVDYGPSSKILYITQQLYYILCIRMMVAPFLRRFEISDRF